ncbi:MAG: hypothetical protein ACOCP8_07495, partial [archaeon]
SPRKEQFKKFYNNEIGLVSCSSAPTAIDLAIQMGCKNIYLIGIDHCKKDNKRYFWEYFSKNRQPKYRNLKLDSWKQQNEVFKKNKEVFKRLQEFAFLKEANIYNCSKLLDNKINIFEYKDILNGY